jgi:hypothetical protein
MIDHDKSNNLRKKLQEIRNDKDEKRPIARYVGVVIGMLFILVAKFFLFYSAQEILLTRISVNPFTLWESAIVYIFIATLIPWSKIWKRKD